MLQVCKDMFSFLHGISRKRLDAIKQSYITNGLETRTHGNSKHLPKHAFSTPEITHVTKFISNFAEANGILLPGRITGYKRMDLQLLPTQMTKRGIWVDYMAATETLTGRTASYRSFCKIWRRYLPHIMMTRPKSDLCWTCQQNSTAISLSTNKSDQEKLKVRHTNKKIYIITWILIGT